MTHHQSDGRSNNDRDVGAVTAELESLVREHLEELASERLSRLRTRLGTRSPIIAAASCATLDSYVALSPDAAQ